MTYFCKIVCFGSPFIHLVPPKRNSNIKLSLLSLPPHPSPLPINLIHCLIFKPLKKLLCLIINNPTHCPSPIQILYRVWNLIIHKILFPTPNPFNYRHNYYMGRYSCEGRFPISCILWMPHFWYWNNSTGDIHK